MLSAALLNIQMLLSQPAVTEDSKQIGATREAGNHFAKDWIFLSALVVIGAVLRFLFLTRKAFWYDEGVSVQIARLDWYNFARLLWRREGNMSLYYLLLRAWLHFGHSEFFIRTLSVLPSAATIPVLYWLGRQLFDRRIALIAATILTFNAYDIRYAQEARSYSLFVFLSTLSSAFFIEFLRQPSQRSRIGHIVTSILAVYAHFYAGLLIITQWLSLRLLEPTKLGKNSPPSDAKKNWPWIVTLVSPVILFVGTTGAGPLSWIKRPGLKEIYEYYEQLLGNGGIPLLLAYLFACVAALVPVGRRSFQRHAAWDAWRYQFLLLWIFFPLVFTVVVSIARPLFLARYLIFCLPAIILLAAVGLGRLPRKWMLVAALLLFVGLSLRGTLSYYDHDFGGQREDWRTASYYILDHATPGDVIIFHIAMSRMPYEFYKSVNPDGLSGPSVIYPSQGARFDYRNFLGRPSAELLRVVPSKYDRVWVVLKYNQTKAGAPDATTLLIDSLFGEYYAHLDREAFPGVEVRLYSKQ